MLSSARRMVSERVSDDVVDCWRSVMYRSRLLRTRLEVGAAAARDSIRPRVQILFYPQLPGRHMMAYKLCAAMGYGLTVNPRRRCDRVMKWEVATFSDDDEVLARLAETHRVVNRHCTDISKAKVNDVFAKAFGYGLGVDPRVHEGEFVEKSDLNAAHDGRTVIGPLEPRDGCTYQRLIDNVRDDGRIMDIRVPVIGRSMPFAYLRFRPVERRFRSGNEQARIAAISDVLSADEVTDVLRFCELLGMDYGELDVLRDRGDGRIYVVDANPTPWGPPSGIGEVDARRAVRLLSGVFESEFVLPASSGPQA